MSGLSGSRTGIPSLGMRPTGGTVGGVGLDVPVTIDDVARQLPGIEELRDHCRPLAMLEAVLSPDWESRYYSFECSHWPERQVTILYPCSHPPPTTGAKTTKASSPKRESPGHTTFLRCAARDSNPGPAD